MYMAREQMRQQADQYGNEFQQIKSEAYKEKLAIMEQHRTQEMALQQQIDALRASLAHQNDIANASRDAVTDMQRRIE